MTGYLNTTRKEECFGCESCVQACALQAIKMYEDEGGFRYPVVDTEVCVQCGLCSRVCPYENPPKRSAEHKETFGGYHKDIEVRGASTSGGAFSAIVDAWCEDNYVIFGADADGLHVYHDYITDKKELYRFRKSKYSQSVIGTAYQDVKRFLNEGKHVVFSGTPCQIAGLKVYLQTADITNLLTIEVICEGVPSPLFVRKYDLHMQQKYGSSIDVLDYRYKVRPLGSPIWKKWDFEVMYTSLRNGKVLKQDRWFNPFWSIWLQHLMSRPSCYVCPFTTTDRVADITLGDLWGVHIYCPELYGKNGGSSLIVANTAKGAAALDKSKQYLYGHELDFDTALKYQGPMRKTIAKNPECDAFMADLMNLNYKDLCRKWANPPTLKLLWSKYVWGNRQKIFVWNIKEQFKKKK